MYLPAAAYRNSFFLSVTRIIADNVTCILQNLTEATPRHPGVHPVHPEELMHADKLNCSNSWCQVVTCEVARLARNSEVSIRLLRVIHEDFFWTAKFKTVKVISTFALRAKEENLLLLEEAAHRREVGGSNPPRAVSSASPPKALGC
uniref:Integrin subunit alpha 10 n=1 Tax=Sphenodon punctatus TaxID=8508 RepID=A0A8D0G793_SPHPU